MNNDGQRKELQLVEEDTSSLGLSRLLMVENTVFGMSSVSAGGQTSRSGSEERSVAVCTDPPSALSSDTSSKGEHTDPATRGRQSTTCQLGRQRGTINYHRMLVFQDGSRTEVTRYLVRCPRPVLKITSPLLVIIWKLNYCSH